MTIVEYIIFPMWFVSSLLVFLIPKDFWVSMYVGDMVRHFGALAFSENGCEVINKAKENYIKNYWKNQLQGCLIMLFIMSIFDLILRVAMKM